MCVEKKKKITNKFSETSNKMVFVFKYNQVLHFTNAFGRLQSQRLWKKQRPRLIINKLQFLTTSQFYFTKNKANLFTMALHSTKNNSWKANTWLNVWYNYLIIITIPCNSKKVASFLVLYKNAIPMFAQLV